MFEFINILYNMISINSLIGDLTKIADNISKLQTIYKMMILII